MVWLVNATNVLFSAYSQAKIYYSWYLNVSVEDSMGNDVPSANVTVTYPNATIGGSQLTDANGLTKFTLVEEMKNATGTHLVGTYSVNATHLSYYDNKTVSMTVNQQIALTLLGFVIPESPSFLVPSLFMIALSLSPFQT